MMQSSPWFHKLPLAMSVLFCGLALAPLPSEALQPTLTLKVDGGTATSIVITSSSTCTSAETTLGYTHCYAINTNATGAGAGLTTNRSYNVRNAPNATARLRIADKAGLDMFSLIGVHFIPALANWGSATANATEQHVLTITMGATFDSTTNTNNGGTYVWGIRAGGELRAGPSPTIYPTACSGFTTTGACNTVGDVITFPGKGTFSPTSVGVNILNPTGSTTNTRPLRLAVAGPTSAIVSFDGRTEQTLGQVNPSYPKFTCDVDGVNTGVNACKPTITQTITVTLKGPDSLVLVNGGDMAGVNCAEGISDKQQNQLDLLAKLLKVLQFIERRRPPDSRLSAFIDRLEAFLATASRPQDPECPGAAVIDLFFAIEMAQDEIAFFEDNAVPVSPSSTITIVKNTSQVTDKPFTFDITGTSTLNLTISMGNQDSQYVIIPVQSGPYSLTETNLPTGWTWSAVDCGPGTTIAPGNTISVVVPLSGDVTCTFQNTFSGTSGTPSFTRLDDLPDGGINSAARGVSSNGSVVVGYGQSISNQEPTRWIAGSIDRLAPGNGDGVATATSDDGSVVVGSMLYGNRAFHWKNQVLTDLGVLSRPLSTLNSSTALDVSAQNGTVVVGIAHYNSGVGTHDISEAFRWTEAGGMVGLGFLSSSYPESGAFAVSQDGSVIVGWSRNNIGDMELFRWTAPTGPMQGLGIVGGSLGPVMSVSADGSIIVGEIITATGSRAFHWSADELEFLPDLGFVSGSNLRSSAKDVYGSISETIIVGKAVNALGIEKAVIWRKPAGGTWSVTTLEDFLGSTLPNGWLLDVSYGISSNGKTIVGRGVNPVGNTEAWKIQLP